MDDDLKKAQLVTERYWELQGLRSALIGTGYALGAGVAILLSAVSPGTDEEIWLLPLAVGLAFLMIMPGMFWLDRFYEQTFGRLKPTAAARRFGLVIVPMTLMVPSLLASAYAGPRGFVAFFIGWAVVGAWVVVRDWPFRSHHLLDVPAGLLGAVALWGTSAHQANNWGMIWAFLVIGTGAIVTGLRDHQLLAATLRGGRSETESVEIKV